MSKVDLATRSIVKTVSFPAGSQPWMLRISPDGKEVWVQTGRANTNVVLDAETMQTLVMTPAGKQPVQAAFQPHDFFSRDWKPPIENPLACASGRHSAFVTRADAARLAGMYSRPEMLQDEYRQQQCGVARDEYGVESRAGAVVDRSGAGVPRRQKGGYKPNRSWPH